MSILAECPICHVKQKVHNRLCHCGADLDKAKKSKRVCYWINFRFSGESNAGNVSDTLIRKLAMRKVSADLRNGKTVYLTLFQKLR